MCLYVFIASDTELPLIVGHPETHSFWVSRYDDEWPDTEGWLLMEHRYIAHSHTYCGCGYEFDEDEGPTPEAQRSLDGLADYLQTCLDLGATVDVLGVYLWGDSPKEIAVISGPPSVAARWVAVEGSLCHVVVEGSDCDAEQRTVERAPLPADSEPLQCPVIVPADGESAFSQPTLDRINEQIRSARARGGERSLPP